MAQVWGVVPLLSGVRFQFRAKLCDLDPKTPTVPWESGIVPLK